ncbi:solute carrier family 35 member F2 isoform X2 [Folsomia candida]|uniref:solute carrier family 35 member F2 isoform X2 n=1 Tax=Folsomia candida TaxID=158441 RepID=UPI0016054B83|nr:solute carrier family 35 member F2 isoform X2 [Folsomia candida]
MLDLELEAEQSQTLKKANCTNKDNINKMNHHNNDNHIQNHVNNCNGKKSVGLSDFVDDMEHQDDQGDQGSSSRRNNNNNARNRRNQKTGICDIIEAQLEHLGKGTTWLSIFLGQVLSGILCASAITSVYLTDTYNIHVPNAQNFAFYITLATIFTTILACRPAERNLFPVLKMRGWKYALVALADAEANFLVVKAYRYTTLTSVQLLDCFTIPTVLSLSWLVLRIRYKVAHILGVSICLLGVCCLVWADIEEGRPLSHGKDRFFGDMLCLSGAFLYGVSNVAQEFVVHSFDLVEFLGMVGLFGSFVSGAQTVLLEYTEVTTAEWGGITGIPVLLLMGFALAQLAFYVLAAFVIKLAGATSYNISILTADFYSLIVGIYLFQYKFHALYFLSFVLVMSGVIVFSIKPTVLDSHVYRSLTREHTTTVDLELMAATPPASCPSGYPLGVGPNGGGSLLDASPTSSCCDNMSNNHCHPQQHHNNIGSGGGADPSYLSSQGCDVVMQTGSLGRRNERYNNTRQMYETNGTYPIPEESDEVC